MKKTALFILVSAVLLVPFSLAAFTTERELFSEAESRYHSKSYTVAIELYDEFIRTFPLSDLVPDAQYRKAVCLFRLQRYEAAKALFEAVEKRYRTTRYIDYVPFWKGVILYELGDYYGSVNNLDLFLETKSEQELTPQALLYKTLSEVSLEYFPEAKKTMYELIRVKGMHALTPYEIVLNSYILLKTEDPGMLIRFQDDSDFESLPEMWKEKALLYRGEALWSLGEIDRSREVYNQLLDAEPRIASTSYRRLYIIAQQNNDFSEMEWILLRAEEKLAGSPAILKDLWLRTGIESFKRGEFDLAEYFLSKVWNLRKPEDAPEAVPMYLAQIMLDRGDTDSAREVLEEYTALTGREPPVVMLMLGNAYILQENFSEAVRVLELIIGKYPDSANAPEARYMLAYSQYRLGKLTPALENCEILIANGGDGFLREVIRLKALVLKKQGDIKNAARTLSGYVASYPQDSSAYVDLIKLLFLNNEYKEVVSLSAGFFNTNPGIEKDDPGAFLLLVYLRGLSRIALKQYNEAIESFDTIDPVKAADTGLSVILPYVDYYEGWAYYRLGDFRGAVLRFLDFLSSYPTHEFAARVLYMSAWCYYSLGDFKKAQVQFSRVARGKDTALEEEDHEKLILEDLGTGDLSLQDLSFRDKALFLEGKSHANLNDLPEAMAVFKRLFEDNPGSPFADDALFEYAGILARKGEVDLAAGKYYELWGSYRSSSLAEEALYKRGELFFNNKLYSKSRPAFKDYRTQYPEGNLVDAALFWEGLSAYEVGEIRGASLMWEKLIYNYRDSPFRPDAMHKTAEVHVTHGKFQKAIDLYEELKIMYPEYSRALNVDLRSDEIRYLVFGFSEREARLTAIISKNGGPETREGRSAMIALSRIYIFEEEGKLERAFQMLSQVLERNDPETGADAQFLLGEYYHRNEEFEKAGRAFFRTSLMKPEDRDFMAYSIYRAAGMMKLAGKNREVKALVERLDQNFSGSEWAEEGKKLLEGVN